MKIVRVKRPNLENIISRYAIINVIKATLIITVFPTTGICTEKSGKVFGDAVEAIWEAGNHRKPTEWLSQGGHRTPSEWWNQSNHRSVGEWLSGTPSRNSKNSGK